ncbi:BrnA antitoxin family protein [Roseixanthobacter liquoris]|uniref:BrnA antitoxin family protein n=1 Tax=Roseixanthobacter liquoris TaxID=3119921 RepID=UPI003726347A
MAQPPFRRTSGTTRDAAEAAFRSATTRPVEEAPKAPKAPVIPGAKETVSLRIDRDVLEFFQEGGPGWQDRINHALRKAMGGEDQD